MPILDVYESRDAFAHICTGFVPAYPGAQVGRSCGVITRGLSLARDLVVERHEDGKTVSATVRCGMCGSTEHLVLDLGPEDEDDGERFSHFHREQARHIRQMMRHPAVGLHDRVRDCRCGAADCPSRPALEPATEGKRARKTKNRTKNRTRSRVEAGRASLEEAGGGDHAGDGEQRGAGA